MFHFYTPWKRQKRLNVITFGYFTFLGGKEMENWTKTS